MEESNLLFKGECPECGSSDANAVYDDGHTHCFSCGHHKGPTEGPSEEGNSSPSRAPKSSDLLAPGEFRALGRRQITEETCRKFRYGITTDKNGTAVQVANFIRDGQVIAQKLRYKNKQFKFLGEKDCGLYGEHLWSPGGRMLVITEGEIDALTVSQLQQNKWPVVSLPNGAQGASKSVRKSYEFVSSFDKVVLMFDMDQPGQEAAKEVAALLKPGQAHIASLPHKDPNECLLNSKGKDVVSAMWNAKPYRPDGVINAADLWEDIIKEDDAEKAKYPWEELDVKTHGLAKGRLVTFCAGSGVGKSAVVREINYGLLEQGYTVGNIMLEESAKRTALGYMGIHLNKPIHLDREGISEEELKNAFEATTGSGRLWLYDHFGSTSAGNLIERIRYLAVGCGCDFITLDHISIAVSDASAQETNLDERKLIDMLMTKLRSLVEELGFGLIVVSHLKRPSGDRGHEEGATTSLSQLRGSHSIAQLSDTVIGLERNQQDEESGNTTSLRVLKNRVSGETGPAGFLYYDHETGRLNDQGMFSASTSGGSSEDY